MLRFSVYLFFICFFSARNSHADLRLSYWTLRDQIEVKQGETLKYGPLIQTGFGLEFTDIKDICNWKFNLGLLTGLANTKVDDTLHYESLQSDWAGAYVSVQQNTIISKNTAFEFGLRAFYKTIQLTSADGIQVRPSQSADLGIFIQPVIKLNNQTELFQSFGVNSKNGNYWQFGFGYSFL